MVTLKYKKNGGSRELLQVDEATEKAMLENGSIPRDFYVVGRNSDSLPSVKKVNVITPNSIDEIKLNTYKGLMKQYRDKGTTNTSKIEILKKALSFAASPDAQEFCKKNIERLSKTTK